MAFFLCHTPIPDDSDGGPATFPAEQDTLVNLYGHVAPDEAPVKIEQPPFSRLIGSDREVLQTGTRQQTDAGDGKVREPARTAIGPFERHGCFHAQMRSKSPPQLKVATDGQRTIALFLDGEWHREPGVFPHHFQHAAACRVRLKSHRELAHRLVQRVFLQVNPRQFICRFILLFIGNPPIPGLFVDNQLRGAVGCGQGE